MKRLLSIVMAFVLAFGLTATPISVQPALANPGTIYVSISGDDTAGDGTAGNPYQTIQKGIDVAVISGDDVTVAAGTYKENIVIKPGVSVTGAGASVTIIEGGGTGPVITGISILPDVEIEGFTITGGSATRGGGIYLENWAVTVISCNISGNSATFGGGIYMSSTLSNMSPEIVNCLIKDNSASSMGGGMFLFGATLSPTIMNSTIADNTAGDGVYNFRASTTITNTIVYGNSVNDITNNSGTVSTGHSLIGTDPLFVGSGDYHLQSGSPAIDAGTATGAPSNDLDGVFRPQGAGVDIGAFEYLLAVNYTLNLTIVGNGTVDLDPAGPTYPSGTVVTLTADPDPGWSFASWSGDVTSSDNPLTITIDGDKDVTASFAQSEYTLTTSVDPAGGGSVSADPAGPYHHGDIVELTATPNAGWSFTDWSGDLSGSTSPTTITMDGDKNVTATFETPTQVIQEIIQFLMEEIDLPRGIENSLISKLESALDSLENGKEKTAANKLNAFINQVEAQTGKKIDSDAAQQLIEAVEDIIIFLVE